MTTPGRDPDRPARLLLTERAALLPILERTPPESFDRPTILPGWSVRDVMAHCGAALSMAARGTAHAFTAELNEADVAERRAWPLTAVIDELGHGYEAAAAAVTAAGGPLDGLALGEWMHGGDIRDALDGPLAYESEGVEDALVLLIERSRQPQRRVPATRVRCGDRELALGADGEAGPRARLSTDPATLVRLCGGRHPDPRRFTLQGAHARDYVLFH
ncbi:MAG: maleylpyruvate isomerase family mycothiol-dependent enzyme [Carbonactinosporaceae bacterium]